MLPPAIPPRPIHIVDHQMHRRSVRARSFADDAGEEDPCTRWQWSAWMALWFLCRLLSFHVANALLGIATFVSVITGLVATLVLLPICCAGVVVFRAVLRTVFVACCADATLHNVVASRHEAIQFPDDPSGLWSYPGERQPLLPVDHSFLADERPRFEASLARSSPRSVVAVFYFGSLKPLLAVASAASLGLLAASVVALVGPNSELSGQQLATALLGAVLAGVALHVVARVTQATTRFFCCQSEA
ncbi:hypothetical protein ATCC90586_004168 [Pythium insidiosum]|nr:hypothetical protein ATCC90586_004168 [Pythium insidiosum]